MTVTGRTLDGQWVVATDLRERNAALRAYSELPAHFYRGDRFPPLE